MTRARMILLAGFSLAFLLLASPLSAEEGKAARRGGPGGFGAGGMFGMMEGNKLSLLGIEQVQKELKLTQEQIGKIGDERKAIGEEMTKLMPGRDVPREERQKRMEENRTKRQELVAASDKKLEAILNADQNKRLTEISLQQRGAQGLKDKAVTDALKLSKEQIEKIDAAIQWGQEEQRKLFQGGGGMDREAMAKMREQREKITQDVEAKALAALTDAQKEQYTKMKGSPFKLDRSAMRGAGGFGGGRRGGAGGGGPGGKTQ